MMEALRMWIASKVVGGNDLGTLVSMMNQQQNAPRRGTAELFHAYRISPWLRAVTTKIAQRFAATEWQLFVKVGAETDLNTNRRKALPDSLGLRYAPPERRRKMLQQLKANDQLLQIDEHLILDLLDNGNPVMTGLAARQLTQVYREIKGEAFWLLRPNAAGVPVEFWPVPPHWVTATPELYLKLVRVLMTFSQVTV